MFMSLYLCVSVCVVMVIHLIYFHKYIGFTVWSVPDVAISQLRIHTVCGELPLILSPPGGCYEGVHRSWQQYTKLITSVVIPIILFDYCQGKSTLDKASKQGTVHLAWWYRLKLLALRGKHLHPLHTATLDCKGQHHRFLFSTLFCF